MNRDAAAQHVHSHSHDVATSKNINLSSEDKADWQAGFDKAKTFFIDSLNHKHVADIELEFTEDKTTSARFDLIARKVYVNKSHAALNKATMNFTFGHELGHDVHEVQKPEILPKIIEASERENEPEFNRISRLREQFCDSLAVIYAGENEVIMHFDNQLLNEQEELKGLLYEAIPELEELQLTQDSLLQITLPLTKSLSRVAKNDLQNSLLSGVEFLISRGEEPNIKAKAVKVDQMIETIQKVLLESERAQGTHGSYIKRRQYAKSMDVESRER